MNQLHFIPVDLGSPIVHCAVADPYVVILSAEGQASVFVLKSDTYGGRTHRLALQKTQLHHVSAAPRRVTSVIVSPVASRHPWCCVTHGIASHTASHHSITSCHRVTRGVVSPNGITSPVSLHHPWHRVTHSIALPLVSRHPRHHVTHGIALPMASCHPQRSVTHGIASPAVSCHPRYHLWHHFTRVGPCGDVPPWCHPRHGVACGVTSPMVWCHPHAMSPATSPIQSRHPSPMASHRPRCHPQHHTTFSLTRGVTVAVCHLWCHPQHGVTRGVVSPMYHVTAARHPCRL